MPVRPLTDVADCLDRSPAHAGGTKVLAIDGPSGSGKTTLAARLHALLGGEVLHMDDIYPGWDGLAQAPDLLTSGILRPLAEHRCASYRRWNWERGRLAETHPVDPGPLLLVEGVGAGALDCAPYLSLLVWVEAPAGVRMRRGIERDGEAYRPHWQRWSAQEAAMFDAERTRQRADLLVDGSPSVTHDTATEFVAAEA